MRYCVTTNVDNDVAQQPIFHNFSYLYAKDGHVLVTTTDTWLQRLFLVGYQDAKKEGLPSTVEASSEGVDETRLLQLFPVGHKCHYHVQSDEYLSIAGTLITPDGVCNVDRVFAFMDTSRPCPLVKLAQLMGIPCTNLADPKVLYRVQDTVMDRTLQF